MLRPVVGVVRRRPARARSRVAGSICLALALASCSSQSGALKAVLTDTAPAPSSLLLPSMPAFRASVPTAPQTEHPLTPAADAARQAAGQYQPAAPTAVTGLPIAPALPRPEADPLAVGRRYLAVRLTYRYDDPTGYTDALTAPAYTTRAFASRSRPGPADLARLQTAQDSSSVQVGDAVLQDDAPDTATTCYVSVAFTVASTYRGQGSGIPQRGVWTLRLVQVAADSWRVDGVPATS